MIKIILLIAALALMSSCDGKKGKTVTVTEAQDSFNVVKLFVVDGCTVYRFNDNSYSRYFTNCKGEVSWTETCGKNCTHPVEIPTETK